jgi:hypothetical protein
MTATLTLQRRNGPAVPARSASHAKPAPKQAAPAGPGAGHASPVRSGSAPARDGLASAGRALESPGRPLDADTRAAMQASFGHDFGHVKVHTGAEAAAANRGAGSRAFTVNGHIAFGQGEYSPGTPQGKRLLAHELAHVVQQGGSGSAQAGTRPSPGAEGEADRAADRAAIGLPAGRIAPAASGRGRPQAKGSKSSDALLMFSMILSAYGKAFTDKKALEAMDEFKKMDAKDRKKAFDSFFADGSIRRLLRAIPAEEADSTYSDETRQLLRWVEEAETRAASGKSDDEMAEKKAKEMKATAEAEAKAKSKSSKAPTAAEIEKEKDKAVADTSIAASSGNRWKDLDKAKNPKKEKDAWLKRGQKAIDDMVAHAAKTHPELKLTKDSFVLDFNGIEERGQGILAMGGTKGGKAAATVGFDFVTTVEVNPAYALSTVVHEIFGHPQYGKYGTEYHLELYDKAVKKAGFKKKAEGTEARRLELDAIAYQETEIYSLMRELPFWTQVSKSDAKKDPTLPGLNPDPADLIKFRVGLIKQQWEKSGLAVALLRGMFARYSADPRVSKAGLAAFVKALSAHFTAKEVKEITK